MTRLPRLHHTNANLEETHVLKEILFKLTLRNSVTPLSRTCSGNRTFHQSSRRPLFRPDYPTMLNHSLQAAWWRPKNAKNYCHKRHENGRHQKGEPNPSTAEPHPRAQTLGKKRTGYHYA